MANMKEGYNPTTPETDQLTKAYWSGDLPGVPTCFDRYDSVRVYVRPLNREIVRKVISNNFRKGDSILEIGSGVGELVENLIPQYRDMIQQSDAVSETVELNKNKHPDSNIVQANVYRLPFNDATFDGIVGFSSFDTFGDLNSAIREMKRVLKPGGRIIHLLDSVANNEAIIANFESRDEFVPFLLANPGDDLDQIKLIPKEIFEKMYADKPDVNFPGLRFYMERKKDATGKPLHRSGDTDEFWESAYKKFVTDFENCDNSCVLNTNQCFYRELIASLKENGFRVKTAKEMKKSKFLKRDKEIFGNINVFVAETPGSYRGGLFDSGIYRKNAFVQTAMHVMVAEKQ